MKYAIFSDVHGNLPALEAVLLDIEGQGVEEILHCGDLVGQSLEIWSDNNQDCSRQRKDQDDPVHVQHTKARRCHPQ